MSEQKPKYPLTPEEMLCGDSLDGFHPDCPCLNCCAQRAEHHEKFLGATPPTLAERDAEITSLRAEAEKYRAAEYNGPMVTPFGHRVRCLEAAEARVAELEAERDRLQAFRDKAIDIEISLRAERDAARTEAAELKRLAGEVVANDGQWDLEGSCNFCGFRRENHSHDTVREICPMERLRAHLSTTTETK
jgi:hypothetical protein